MTVAVLREQYHARIKRRTRCARCSARERYRQCGSSGGGGLRKVSRRSMGSARKGQVPTIAGMSAPYLQAQMSAYPESPASLPEDVRTDMCEIAKKLTPAQVNATVTYFASQKFVAAKQAIDPALAAKGKSLHDSRCAVCHSMGGSAASRRCRHTGRAVAGLSAIGASGIRRRKARGAPIP